jgi:hypothetical protein
MWVRLDHETKAVQLLTFACLVRLQLQFVDFGFGFDLVTHYDADKVKLLANSWDIQSLAIKHQWHS